MRPAFAVDGGAPDQVVRHLVPVDAGIAVADGIQHLLGDTVVVRPQYAFLKQSLHALDHDGAKHFQRRGAAELRAEVLKLHAQGRHLCDQIPRRLARKQHRHLMAKTGDAGHDGGFHISRAGRRYHIADGDFGFRRDRVDVDIKMAVPQVGCGLFGDIQCHGAGDGGKNDVADRQQVFHGFRHGHAVLVRTRTDIEGGDFRISLGGQPLGDTGRCFAETDKADIGCAHWAAATLAGEIGRAHKSSTSPSRHSVSSN